MSEIRARLANEVQVPPGTDIEYGGLYKIQQESFQGLSQVLLAAILGMLPLAFGIRAGAQILRPLAIAVIGGVTVSLVLSLFATPILYHKLRQWAAPGRHGVALS